MTAAVSNSSRSSAVRCLEGTVKSIDDVVHFSASLVSGWGPLDDTSVKSIRVERVAGGITNSIYRVKCAMREPFAVIVRIFGGEDVFTAEERKVENEIFEQLGEAGIAPKLLGLFGNGRIEQHLNARPISLDEMVATNVLIGVAVNMARMHRFCPKPPPARRKAGVWASLDKWIPEAVRLHTTRAFPKDFSLDMKACVEGFERLRASLEPSSSPIVFCHNDLLAGNILLSLDDASTVFLVDFEYSSFNYRGFDIGNFFCEAMGGTQDGHVDSSRYPDEEKRWMFCSAYLRETTGDPPTAAEVSGLVEEAERYALVSHLYWGFWALLQSTSSAVDFPYILFAEQRFTQFFKAQV